MRGWMVTRGLPDGGPIVVGILHPLDWYGDTDAAAAALDALRALDPRLQVEPLVYLEGHDLRTARGNAAGAEAARSTAQPLTDEQRDLFGRAHAVIALDLPYDVDQLAPNLAWVQAVGAGTGQLQSAGLGTGGIRLTNAAGTNAVAIAEFVIGRILEHAKRFTELANAQRERQWLSAYGAEISQWTVGLVGLGNINAAVASRLAAFGVTVLGARRNLDADPVDGVSEVYSIDRLNDMLVRCDAVVAAVPETAASIGLFGAEQFAVIKRDALFVNVGRGSAVDEAALIDALESGHLGAAALDVASEEPLPADHPLWSAPNIAISGHCAASPTAMFPNLYRLFADNLARLLRGDALRNEVDLTRGY